MFLDNFGLDSSSGDSDDDFKDHFSLFQTSVTDNPNDEKMIAQKQLLKAAKSQKSKMSRKKILAKGGKAAGKDKSQIQFFI